MRWGRVDWKGGGVLGHKQGGQVQGHKAALLESGIAPGDAGGVPAALCVLGVRLHLPHAHPHCVEVDLHHRGLLLERSLTQDTCSSVALHTRRQILPINVAMSKLGRKHCACLSSGVAIAMVQAGGS